MRGKFVAVVQPEFGGKPDRKVSVESRAMLGAHRRGFDWKEIAEVLHMTRAVTRSTFWREIKRTKSKKVEAQSDGTASQRERDSDTPKIERPGTSRST